MMQQVCILTYQCNHRKTYDTLCLLRALGYRNVVVYATPLMYKKKFSPLIEHRPGPPYPLQKDLSWKQVILNFDYELFEINDYSEINEIERTVFLVCGAGLLPEYFLEKYCVINAHPGYIPYARGLDAYKWAIWEKNPIGVSTHIIGKQVDAGEVIQRKLVTIKAEDTFHAVAQRVYEMEVSMLVEAIQHLDEPHTYYDGDEYPVHRRMPREIEQQLFKKFDILKEMQSEEMCMEDESIIRTTNVAGGGISTNNVFASDCEAA